MRLRKKAIAIMMAAAFAALMITPAYGMSILDSPLNAGAGAGSGSQGSGNAGSTGSPGSAGAGSGEHNIISPGKAMEDVTGSPDGAEDEAPAEVGVTVPARSTGNDIRINDGVYAGSVDLSGLNEAEATTAVNSYVSSLGSTPITLNCVSGNQVEITASSIGLHWTNTSIINEALSLGQAGNVIKRFKELSDLKRTNKIYPVEMSVDEQTLKGIIASDCVKYDVKAEDALMSRSNGEFNITPGRDGMSVNVDASVRKVADTVVSQITGSPMSIDLEIEVVKPRGDAETLSRLTDKLGTFMTRFYSSGADRVTNVTNGCRLINGTLLYPGEQISVSETISPMTEENGYALAGSYLNGQVVESFGGGICQVSTTLYQAVLRAELQVDERYNHSMVVNYVDHSGDAAIAEGIKDFKFTNNLDNPIYIDGYTTPDKTITFTIYGIETRPENRTLEFESEDLEEIEPGPDRVIADSSMAAGSTKKQSAHIGYRSELYKIVKVDGVETERIKVNSSTYQAVPAILTVGTATADPGVKAILESAIATQDIEYCRAIASGQAPAAAVSEETLAALAQAAEGEGGEQTVENPPD